MSILCNSFPLFGKKLHTLGAEIGKERKQKRDELINRDVIKGNVGIKYLLLKYSLTFYVLP